jgi:hypothetical protein
MVGRGSRWCGRVVEERTWRIRIELQRFPSKSREKPALRYNAVNNDATPEKSPDRDSLGREDPPRWFELRCSDGKSCVQ